MVTYPVTFTRRKVAKRVEQDQVITITCFVYAFGTQPENQDLGLPALRAPFGDSPSGFASVCCRKRVALRVP